MGAVGKGWLGFVLLCSLRALRFGLRRLRVVVLSVAVPLQFGLQLVVVPAVAVAGLRHGSMRGR